MELIPILSTIILVATISTFLLAIGAYVLYKVREQKGQAASVLQPSEIKAELVTPAVSATSKVEKERIIPQPIYAEPQPVPAYQRQPIILEQEQMPTQHTKFTPKPQPYSAYRTTFATPVEQQRSRQGQSYQSMSSEENQFRDSKFLKYTTEGYVPAKEDKDAGALKWR
jgi:hypothetical protein